MEKTLGFILKIVINFFIRHENTTVCNTKTMTLILSLFEMKFVYQSDEFSQFIDIQITNVGQ